MADTFFFDVESYQYQSGWLESTETTVLRFHPTVLANLGNNIPDNIRAVLEKPITMINHVHHQPFANGIVPVRAVVETEFQYDPEVKKTLARFFGEQIPIKLHNVIKLNGSGTLNITVAPFDYEELSGIKINWQGLTGNINYQNGYASYTTQLAMPSFQAILADKGSLKIENLTLNANSYNSKDGKTTLGSSTTNLAHFNVSWNEGMDYNIKINDLINTVTDLQIGAFINPRGTIAPNKISVDNLSYATETSEPEAGYLNTSGKFSFAKLNYGSDNYGPLAIHVSAEHLDAESLAALKTRRDQLITQRLSDEQMREALLAALRNEAAGLFTNDPVIRLKQFDLTTPQGMISGNGELKFSGLTTADLNDIDNLLAKTDADFHIAVPQQVIERLTAAQAKNYISVDPSLPDADHEIQEAVRLWLDNVLESMARQGYLKIDGKQIVSTHIVMRNKTFSMNGKRIESQADENLLPDSSLPADSSAPATPASVPAAASAASTPPKGASAP